MAVTDVYEVAIIGQQTGSLIVATLNYETTGATGTKQQEMEALAEAALATLIPAFSAMQSDQVIYNTIRVRDVHDDTLGVDRPVSGAGSRTSEAMPKQNAALFLWKTGFIGRSNAGRLYLGGITEDTWDGEAWTSAWLTIATTFANGITPLVISDFPDPGNDFSFAQVVYSDLLDQSRSRTTWGLSPNPATQRRRKSGVGS